MLLGSRRRWRPLHIHSPFPTAKVVGVVGAHVKIYIFVL